MKLSLRARKAINALPIEVLLPKWGELSGHETSTVLGDEADFNEYKAYALGDEVRRIDWKVYARRERYFIKRYASERARSTLVIIDASASMEEAFAAYRHPLHTGRPLEDIKNSENLGNSGDLGNLNASPTPSHSEPKSQTIATTTTVPATSTTRSTKMPGSQDGSFKGMVGVLGYLFHYLYLKQEPYGVSVIRKGNIDFYKVREGSKQLQRMEQVLKTLQAQGTNFYTQELIETLQQAREVKNIIFFSDFQTEPRALIPFVKAVSRNQLSLTCIAYFNPKLLDIRFLSGLRWIKDRETGSSAVINHRDMKAYRKIILNHYEEIERFLVARGAVYHQLDFREKDELTNFIALFKR